MQNLNEILSLIDGFIGGSDWFVFALLASGAFFTIYLGFPQIRYFGHAIKAVMGKFDKAGDSGDTSHFGALTTALSGTVGTGNIAGVALAIHLGGPAALFWMLVTAFLGMTTKFVEVTLSHKYREFDEKGNVAGGPMYYMKNANFIFFGKNVNLKWLAVIFAIATVLSSFGTGNLPQVNSISDSLFTTFRIDKMLTGAILAVLLGLVIIGGIKRIVKVTERLVPTMAFIYLIGALLVIGYNYENIIPSFLSIFTDVFTGTAAVGGFLGANFTYAFNRGVNRGLFSNEAGQGSAPIAHAAAKAHEPVSEGVVAILEPFIDTIIICTITGLVLLSSGAWNEKLNNRFELTDLKILDGTWSDKNTEDQQHLHDYLLHGTGNIENFTGDMEVANGLIVNEVTVFHARSVADNVVVYKNNELYNGNISVANGNINDQGGQIYLRGESLVHSAPLTTRAFTRSILGDYGKYIVSIGLLLFAFSTTISWSYYGDRAMTFLFGAKSVIYYRIVYVIGFFVASFADTTIIWTLSGITIALMTLPNLLGIFWLRSDMKRTVKDYWAQFNDEFPDHKKKK